MLSGKVPLLCEKKLPLVGVGKHLCGAATGENSQKSQSALIGGKQHLAHNSTVTAALRWFLQVPSCSLMAVHLHLC